MDHGVEQHNATNPITVNPMLLTVTVTVKRLFWQLNWTASTPATTDLVVYGCLGERVIYSSS